MIEKFHGIPSTEATVRCGVTFSWVEKTGGMGVVPVVGILTTVGTGTNISLVADPALVRSLIADLTAGLTYLENAK